MEYDADAGEVTLMNDGMTAEDVCFAVASYNAEGRMLSCPIRSGVVRPGERVTVPLSVTEIPTLPGHVVSTARAFVLDADTFRPIMTRGLL